SPFGDAQSQQWTGTNTSYEGLQLQQTSPWCQGNVQRLSQQKASELLLFDAQLTLQAAQLRHRQTSILGLTCATRAIRQGVFHQLSFGIRWRQARRDFRAPSRILQVANGECSLGRFHEQPCALQR